jgi:NDP-sugar pyrophosphorylase family protein
MKPTLVILAAGIGSRYGGVKQMDRVGPSGETIMDYSLYDAKRAGFGKTVFVIRRSIEKDFREAFLDHLAGRVEVDFVFQELEDLPPGFAVPDGRVKPWGTSHAVLQAEAKVATPFAVINADDFYGLEAFRIMADFLSARRNDETLYAVVAYLIDKTLSEHGSVARGVCEVGAGGWLEGIVERTHVERTAEGIVYKDEQGRFVSLPPEKAVSMNFWGFTPTYFKYGREIFEDFLRHNIGNMKAELFIPLVVNQLIKRGEARVRILPTSAKWFGVTYQEDKPRVVEALRALVSSGAYPPNLWGV